MPKSTIKQPSHSLPAPAPNANPTPKIAKIPKTEKSDAASKQSHVIGMLQSPSGATIAAMMKATGWQQHSVRGFLAGVVRKRLNLNLDSKIVDGTRVYQIASKGGLKPTAGKAKRRSS